jgi:hypothetical protein
MNDPADHAAVIDTPRPRLVLRQKRLDHRPGPVRRPKFNRHGPHPPKGRERESDMKTKINRLIGFGP